MRTRDDMDAIQLPGAVAFLTAQRCGDASEALRILEREPFGVWFSVAPATLAEMLSEISIEDIQRDYPMTAMIAGILRGETIIPRRSDNLRMPWILPLLGDTVQHISLRLAGRPRAALPFAKQVTSTLGRMGGVGDARTTTIAFTRVQEGICAHLAGEFNEALTAYTAAQLCPLPRTMAFLLRDAAAKSALIHASYGDPADARAQLDVARRIRRTTSWTEPHIDACIALAEALLLSEVDPEAGKSAVSTIPLHDLGELWPAYVEALWLVGARSGNRDEATTRIERLSATSIAPANGDGLPSSSIATALASNKLFAGDIGAARTRLARADPRVPFTSIVRARISNILGKHSAAFNICLDLQPRTRGLRSLDIWRKSIMASALLGMGERTQCLSVVRDLAALPGGLSNEERSLFDADVTRLAEESMPEWVSPMMLRGGNTPATTVSLTRRERDVLEGLARGETRTAIADRLYLSLNTVKTHQRGLFRKLGVDSRVQAMVQAERHGLLWHDPAAET